MTTEEVAMYCTTPGGRRRDDMNFYTSGMKIVEIKEKPSLHSARDMVELTFEQIIPGTQRLVAKCPIDHPFYVKHKGWSASNTTEAMARYGTPFRPLQKNDIVISHPSKSNPTPAHTASPRISTNAPQVFTFSVLDTSRFSQQKKSETLMPPPSIVPDEKPVSTSSTASHNISTTSSENLVTDTKHLETITLTYTARSPQHNSMKPSTSQLRLVNEFKSLSEDMKRKVAQESVKTKLDENSNEALDENSDSVTEGQQIDVKKNKKKRRKPLLGNEKDRRPMNGFMLFAKDMRVELTKMFPGKDNRAISKLLGERWRELSEEKREDYSRMAKEMADERMKVNPDCWKRKHRKDKDSTGKSSSSAENESPENKKIKLHSPTNELLLPAGFIESGTKMSIDSPPQNQADLDSIS